MKTFIDRADKVQVGDIVAAHVANDQYERGMHWMGKILEITKPHAEITQFKVRMLVHDENKLEESEFGYRHGTKLLIMR